MQHTSLSNLRLTEAYGIPLAANENFAQKVFVQIMQVKNFGRRGRTKYTHLLDQDTSVRDDYYNLDGASGSKKGRRLAGTEQVFEKPKKFIT